MSYPQPSAPLPGQENPQALLQFPLGSRLLDLSHVHQLDLFWQPASRLKSFKILLIIVSTAFPYAQQEQISSFLIQVPTKIRHSSVVKHP